MFTLIRNAVRWACKRRAKKLTLVLLGLDNAGKTTLLHAIRGSGPEAMANVAPTYGFSKESVAESPYTIDIFDLGGGKRIRGIWKQYLAEVHGVVFVVDAADAGRFAEAREVLGETLASEYLSGKPILIMANKQDLPTAGDAPAVAAALGLSALSNNRYQILPCCAKPPSGSPPDKRVKDGMRWLASQVGGMFRELEPRVRREAAVEAARMAEEKEARKKRVAEARAKREAEREAAEAAAPAEGEGALLVTHGAGLEPGEQRNQINAGQPGSPLKPRPGESPVSPGAAIPGGVRSGSPQRVVLQPLPTDIAS
mmetsp:Transcript_2153/g.5461  ORF Transcript_2153/g.5461 Transcript_2153/m.5461 type:complete len:312 (-) Transcript_2153:355-1290(-)